MLNKLLLQSGLGIAIIENPNQFDFYSQAELSQRVKEGLNRVRTVDQRVITFPNIPCIYLQNNPNISALFVLNATVRITYWKYIPEKQREKAVQFFAEILSKHIQIALTREQSKELSIQIAKVLAENTKKKNPSARLYSVDANYYLALPPEKEVIHRIETVLPSIHLRPNRR